MLGYGIDFSGSRGLSHYFTGREFSNSIIASLMSCPTMRQSEYIAFASASFPFRLILYRSYNPYQSSRRPTPQANDGADTRKSDFSFSAIYPYDALRTIDVS